MSFNLKLSTDLSIVMRKGWSWLRGGVLNLDWGGGVGGK